MGTRSCGKPGLNVKISEPDVSPLQLQGPTSGKIMENYLEKILRI